VSYPIYKGYTWPLDVSGMPPDVRIEYRVADGGLGCSLLNLYKGTGALYVIKHVAITFCILSYTYISLAVERRSFYTGCTETVLGR